MSESVEIRIVEDKMPEKEVRNDAFHFPPHNVIYQRDPKYDKIMEQYEKQRQLDRARNEAMYRDTLWHQRHRHPKPHIQDPRPHIHESSPLLQQKRHPIKFESRRIPTDIREKYLNDQDLLWDRKYHTKRGDTYLQTKHRDFDKYWSKQERIWNKRFHDTGDWSWKPRHYHGDRDIFARDPYDMLPEELYPRFDRYWSHDWYDHFHTFEGTKRMTLAYHHRYHEEMVNLEDYYHPEIRNLGPSWWLRHLKRQLETDPRPMYSVNNVADVILDNFPICIFVGRYEKVHEKTTNLIRKYRHKTDLSKDSVIYVSLDNSRACLKIYSDLKHTSPMQNLPQVWLNNRLLGGYDSVKKLARVGRLEHLMREAEFEGKMPCETCQSVVKDWYKTWHKEHYPYFDKAAPY